MFTVITRLTDLVPALSLFVTVTFAVAAVFDKTVIFRVSSAFSTLSKLLSEFVNDHVVSL